MSITAALQSVYSKGDLIGRPVYFGEVFSGITIGIT